MTEMKHKLRKFKLSNFIENKTNNLRTQNSKIAELIQIDRGDDQIQTRTEYYVAEFKELCALAVEELQKNQKQEEAGIIE